MLTRKWRLLPLAAALLALPLAVACGDDDDTETPITVAATAAATTAAASPTTATSPTTAARPSAAATTAPTMDIVQTATAAGSFKTLEAALVAAMLVETLKGTGPFTVLAPTDAAFAALPAGTVEGLLADRAKLRAVLTYHVVAGRVPASEVVKLTEATTVNGQKVAIKVEGGKVMVNDATVTTPDVAASNGVIHVIDKVLLPK